MSTLFDNNLKMKDGIKVLWLHEGEKKERKENIQSQTRVVIVTKFIKKKRIAKKIFENSCF